MLWQLKPSRTSFHSGCNNLIKIPSFNNPNADHHGTTGQFPYEGSGPEVSAPSSCPLSAGPVRSGWPQPGPARLLARLRADPTTPRHPRSCVCAGWTPRCDHNLKQPSRLPPPAYPLHLPKKLTTRRVHVPLSEVPMVPAYRTCCSDVTCPS